MTNYISRITCSPHTLIAGTTGSGKTVLLNKWIIESLEEYADSIEFKFIDMKRIELDRYRKLKQCVGYADNHKDALDVLRNAVALMDSRYKKLKRHPNYPYKHLYIVIDELADLMTSRENKKEYTVLIQRICQLGRSAKIHLVACTQCPLASIIPTAIKVNFTTIFGLRTRSAQDSRNIIGTSGCESLPRYGYAYESIAEGLYKVKIDMIDELRINKVIKANKRLFAI